MAVSRTLALIFIFVLGSVKSRKYHIGPCLYVTNSEACPDKDYIGVYLYTSTQEAFEIKYDKNSDNLASSSFNPEYPTKIIQHGFNADMYLDILQNIRKEYIKMGNVNVFMVNYPKYMAGGWCYLAAQHNVVHIGRCIALLVAAIRRHSSKYIHVVGFSLGAQITNHIALQLEKNKQEQLNRITGLDPAGPAFSLMPKNHRLDKTDAKFVDVVHTNGGIQGDIQEIGHVDFYVNGGVTQPGCFRDKGGIGGYLNCNHRRAAIYFAESINTKVGFLGWACENTIAVSSNNCPHKEKTILMGEHCPVGNWGVIYLRTAAKSPFALGDQHSG